MRRNGFALLVATASLGVVARAAAQPSTNVNDYVLFAVSAIKTKGPTITQGDVGVNTSGGLLLAPRFFTAPNSVVASDRIRFDKDPGSTTLAQLYANVVDQYGPIGTPFTPPIIANVRTACGFPTPFPTCTPGVDVDVAVGTTTLLPPGTYGKVRVHGTSVSAGMLLLTGGTYTFCDLTVSRNAQLRVQVSSMIDVVGKASFGPSTFLGPDTGSGLVASDIQLHVAGSLVKLTRDSVSEAHVCAPDAKLRMSQGGTHIGVSVADSIRTDEVTLAVGQ